VGDATWADAEGSVGAFISVLWIALAVAVSLRARNEAPCTLVLGLSRGRGYAVVFA